MAAEPTARFQIYRWTSDSDSLTREQMDQSHLQLETLAAKIKQGLPNDSTLSEAASGANAKTFFYDTTNKILYYADGTSWKKINNFGTTGDMQGLVIATTSNSAGTSNDYARIDHRHAGPGFAAPAATSTANAAGSATTISRSDHVHTVGDHTLTSAKFDTSVAGAGLSISDSAMSVNTDNSTLEISGDSVRIKPGGVTNAHTDVGSRLVRKSQTTAPSTNVAVGDVWLKLDDDQLYQCTAIAPSIAWTPVAQMARKPSVKVSWTTSYSAAINGFGGGEVIARWDTCGFPALAADKNIWAPGGDFAATVLAGYYTLMIPYDGFYLFAGDGAWDASPNVTGSRQVALFKNSVGEPDEFVQQPGGASTNYVSTIYTRLACTTFLACRAGDLIQLRMTHAACTGQPMLQGANLTITFMSALV